MTSAPRTEKIAEGVTLTLAELADIIRHDLFAHDAVPRWASLPAARQEAWLVRARKAIATLEHRRAAERGRG